VRKREKERVDERERRLGEDLELGGGDDGGGGGCLNRREWRLVRGALVSTCDVQEKVRERERVEEEGACEREQPTASRCEAIAARTTSE